MSPLHSLFPSMQKEKVNPVQSDSKMHIWKHHESIRKEHLKLKSACLMNWGLWVQRGRSYAHRYSCDSAWNAKPPCVSLSEAGEAASRFPSCCPSHVTVWTFLSLQMLPLTHCHFEFKHRWVRLQAFCCWTSTVIGDEGTHMSTVVDSEVRPKAGLLLLYTLEESEFSILLFFFCNCVTSFKVPFSLSLLF